MRKPILLLVVARYAHLEKIIGRPQREISVDPHL